MLHSKRSELHSHSNCVACCLCCRGNRPGRRPRVSCSSTSWTPSLNPEGGALETQGERLTGSSTRSWPKWTGWATRRTSLSSAPPTGKKQQQLEKWIKWGKGVKSRLLLLQAWHHRSCNPETRPLGSADLHPSPWHGLSFRHPTRKPPQVPGG